MPTNTILTQIESSLKSVGKKVNLTPQEKLRNDGKEILLLVTGIELEVETSKSYIMNVEVSVMWEELDGKEMVENIKTNITTIEEGFTSMPMRFRFESPEIEPFKIGYGVSLPCRYSEVVTIN